MIYENDLQEIIKAYVTPDLDSEMILGWQDVINLKIIPKSFPKSIVSTNKILVNPKEGKVASKAFEKVLIDVFQLKGQYYIVMVDRYFGWPMVAQLRKTDATIVTRVLLEWFNISVYQIV